MNANNSFRKTIFIVSIGSCFNLHGQAPSIDWQNTIGGNQDDRLEHFAVAPDGGFILGGTSVSGISGDKTEPNWGPLYTSDYWVVKTDASGNIEWQNDIGGTDLDQLYDIKCTSDGGFILGGYSSSPISGDKTEPSLATDYWIVKLNAAGSIEWQRALGGSSGDICSQIIQTTDGGYLAAGWSFSGISGEKTSANQGSSDYWIIKLDNAGNVQWDKTYGGNSVDELFACRQTADGGYILGGQSFSGISGNKTENRHGSGDDYWIIKTDASGTILWQNTIGGNKYDYLQSLIETDDGGFLLGGYSNSSVSFDKTLEANGTNSYDYWVVKTDAMGTVIWDKIYGGKRDDLFSSITALQAGNYLLTGQSYSDINGNKTEANMDNFYRDIWILKIDDTGNIIWQDDIWANLDEQGCSAETTPDGGFAVVGYSTSGIGGDKTEATNGSWDIWMMKFAGDLSCDAPDGIYSDNITAATAKIHWNAVPAATKYQVNYRPVAGGTWLKKNATVTSKNLIGLSPNSAYEYKIKTICADGMSLFSSSYNFTTLPLRQGENETGLPEFVLAPNPAADMIRVTLDATSGNDIQNLGEASDYLIIVLNATGQILITQYAGSNNNYFDTSIDISKLSSGIYSIHCIRNSDILAAQFVKE